LTSPIERSSPGVSLCAPLAAAAAAAGRAASKSNPHDSQKRPDLASPHCGQGLARAAGLVATDGCASGGKSAGRAAGRLAGTSIRIPQTSQKSLLTET